MSLHKKNAMALQQYQRTAASMWAKKRLQHQRHYNELHPNKPKTLKVSVRSIIQQVYLEQHRLGRLPRTLDKPR